MWVILAYSWILGCCIVCPLIPLVLASDDETARWHSKHGLVIAGFFFAASLVLHLLRLICSLLPDPVDSALEWVFLSLWGVVYLLVLGNNAFALFRALNQERWCLKKVAGLIERLPV